MQPSTRSSRLLAIALASMTGMYLNKRDEMAALEGSVQAIGEAAIEDKARIEAEGKANLTKIKEDHESKVPEIRAGAVAAYLAAHRVRNADPRGGEVPNPGAGQPLMMERSSNAYLTQPSSSLQPKMPQNLRLGKTTPASTESR